MTSASTPGKLRLYSKKQHEIVSDLGLIEHVAVTQSEAAQSLVLTLSDVSPFTSAAVKCVDGGLDEPVSKTAAVGLWFMDPRVGTC